MNLWTQNSNMETFLILKEKMPFSFKLYSDVAPPSSLGIDSAILPHIALTGILIHQLNVTAERTQALLQLLGVWCIYLDCTHCAPGSFVGVFLQRSRISILNSIRIFSLDYWHKLPSRLSCLKLGTYLLRKSWSASRIILWSHHLYKAVCADTSSWYQMRDLLWRNVTESNSSK